MNETPVTAVIPTYNHCESLLRVIAGLREQTTPPASILVVDNGSTDGAGTAAADAGARVLPMGRNAGFAAAVNRGLREAGTEWVAILNNDVTLAENWLERLLAAATATGAWFATGRLLQQSDPRRLDGAFDLLCRGGCAWRAGSGRRDGPLWHARRPISFAPFTAVLLRREIFARVGYLDEYFESYLEDIDFGLRCALAGLKGVYVPEAVAHHEGSATFGRWGSETVRRISRNQVLLIAKHYPSGWRRRHGWAVLVAQGLWGLVAIRHGAGWAWLKGKWQARLAWSAFRTAGSPGLDAVLAASEAELHELQRQSGYDRYWRMYFLLT